MASPDDIQGVEFYPQSEEFIIIRNSGTISNVYSMRDDNDLFLRVVDWANSGTIEADIVEAGEVE
jgi:hypothetical protein